MSSPNRGRQCETQPTQGGGWVGARASETGGNRPERAGSRRDGTPPEPTGTHREPDNGPTGPTGQPAGAGRNRPEPAGTVRDWLSGLRWHGVGLNPATVADLAQRPEIASASLERLAETWRRCEASGLADALGGFVARLRRGEGLARPPAGAMRWNAPRLAELAADAVPAGEARANARRIRDSMRARAAEPAVA